MSSSEVVCPHCGGSDVKLSRDYGNDNPEKELVGAIITCKNRGCKKVSRKQLTEDAYTTWSANNL